MPKLNDTHTILLSAASRRDDLALYPLEGISRGARTVKAIDGLIRSGFAERRGEDAVYATAAGLIAIGVEIEQKSATPDPALPAEPRLSKTAAVLALLHRGTGATMSELIALTSWLPHTTRAALTGLRKRGHAIQRSKRDDQTCYRIGATQ